MSKPVAKDRDQAEALREVIDALRTDNGRLLRLLMAGFVSDGRPEHKDLTEVLAHNPQLPKLVELQVFPQLELRDIREAFAFSASAIVRTLGYPGPNANVAAAIRRLVAALALILVAIDLAHSPALTDDAGALIGRWLVPRHEQKKSRMSPQCQKYAETDVQPVPASELEIFSCDDPAFAPQKTRILEFVRSVNEVYRAQNRPLYSERSRGYARSCARRLRNGRPIFAIRAKSCAGLQSKICRSSGISGHQETTHGRWRVIATLPRRATGRSPVLSGPLLVKLSRKDAAGGASRCR
jgi:hypothetical protein